MSYDESMWLLVSMLFVTGIVTVLYYRGVWNAREQSFIEQLEYKQELLNITFWATGDSVVDTELDSQQVCHVNINPDIPVSEVRPHFFDETFLNRINKEDRAYVRSSYETNINSGNNSYELHYRIDSELNNSIWVVEKGIVLERNKQGKALRLISNFRDVTSLKQEQSKLEQLAKELERRLRLAEAAQIAD